MIKTSSTETTKITTIQTLIAEDMLAVNRLIQKKLDSDIALINQLSLHIINSGGKRLRPILLLLSAKCFQNTTQDTIQLAAVIEFIHTATLIHDDIVDESELRRGQQTANNIWGNAASVLVGDFLYSRSFQMMVDLNNIQVMRLLSDTTNTIAQGEVLQLLNTGNPDTSEANYIKTIKHKTAVLFAAATEIGAILSKVSPPQQQAMADYGLNLGMAFQLTDDILDYTASSEELGKNIGDDLAEGKPTLPLIYAMQHGSTEQRDLIKQAIEHKNIENLPAIQQAITATQAIEYTYQLAKHYQDKALAALTNIPTSKYKKALESLATFAVQRRK